MNRILAIAITLLALQLMAGETLHAKKGSVKGGLKASEVMGQTVWNSAGEKLGEIKELVIDPEEGEVAYAVLAFGGFLGLGDKYFAIPWGTLQSDPGKGRLVLDVDKKKLKDAPGFDKNNWPDLTDREVAVVIYKFYDEEPYWHD